MVDTELFSGATSNRYAVKTCFNNSLLSSFLPLPSLTLKLWVFISHVLPFPGRHHQTLKEGLSLISSSPSCLFSRSYHAWGTLGRFNATGESLPVLCWTMWVNISQEQAWQFRPEVPLWGSCSSSAIDKRRKPGCAEHSRRWQCPCSLFSSQKYCGTRSTTTTSSATIHSWEGFGANSPLSHFQPLTQEEGN